MRILIATGETLLLRVLELRLNKDGHEIFSVRNGKDALNSILLHPPDLVIADIILPLISGLQLLEKMKSSSVTRNIPVYILTDSQKEKAMSDALDLGAEDLIAMPFDPEEISDKIRKLIRWH